MRSSAFLMAVSASALLVGCTKNTDSVTNTAVVPHSGKIQTAEVHASATPLVELAREAMARGDAAAAIPLAERALDGQPGDLAATRVLAEATLISGDPVKAESLFRTVVSNDPNSAGAKAGLGLSLLAQQRSSDAIAVLRDAAKLNPSVSVMSNIAFALTLAGAPTHAISLLEPMVSKPESTPKMRQNLAFAYVANNQRARAFEIAGYDLDGVAAARQVAVWSDSVRLPMATQITQLAGLKVVDASAYAQAKLVVAPLSMPVIAEQAKPTSVVLAENVGTGQVVQASDVVVTSEKGAEQSEPGVEAVDAAPVVVKTQIAKVKVLAPAAKTAPVQSASFNMSSPVAGALADSSIVAAAPKIIAAATSSVQKVESWLVQVAAVRATSAQSVAKVQREYRALFGKSTVVKLVPVTNGANSFQRVFIGQPQSRSAAMNTCMQLRSKGTACLVRNGEQAGEFKATNLVAVAKVAKPVMAKPATVKPAEVKKLAVKISPKATVTPSVKPVPAKTEAAKVVKI